MGNWIWILMDEQMDFIMEMKMDKLMGNKWEVNLEKTIWLQRMIKMMDKIDNFRSKHWKTIGYKN